MMARSPCGPALLCLAWALGGFGCGGARLADLGQAPDAVDAFEVAAADQPDTPVQQDAAELSDTPALPDAADLSQPDLPDAPDVLDLDPTGEIACPLCAFTMRMDQDAVLVVVPDGAQIAPTYGAVGLRFTDDSYVPALGAAGIRSRTWDVTGPSIATAAFTPDHSSAQVQFLPMLVGAHTFALSVENAAGCSESCLQTVHTVPLPGCMVELTWNTPADPDQTDTCGQSGINKDCGSDMDLHVLDPRATGAVLDPRGQPYGYFDEAYDCYWMNANPKAWDAAHVGDPAYQPHLVRDDTDGAGPEVFHYALPPSGTCYRVGVHYFDDHGFGRSYPTLRVYLDDPAPVYEKTLAVALNTSDMWDAGTVCCGNPLQPFVEFKAANGQDPVILPNYTSPF